MKGDIKKVVRECEMCRRMKYETSHPVRLLQPLPIPKRTWTDISLDFIEGLPISKGVSVIFMVVDRFTKYAHFIALAHLYTAQTIAEEFMKQVFKLQVFPQSLLSDRDTIFVSSFWKALFHAQGSDIDYSSAYYSQKDGQTETVNKCIEGY